jgi:hypothetical protein
VVLACRDLAAATQVCEEVIKATGNEKVHALHLDLCDFDSIDTFVEQLANCKNCFSSKLTMHITHIFRSAQHSRFGKQRCCLLPAKNSHQRRLRHHFSDELSW